MQTLLHENYEISIATNGEDAIKLAQETPSPDLIRLP